MSASRNTNNMINQQIQMLKKVTSHRYNSTKKRPPVEDKHDRPYSMLNQSYSHTEHNNILNQSKNLTRQSSKGIKSRNGPDKLSISQNHHNMSAYQIPSQSNKSSYLFKASAEQTAASGGPNLISNLLNQSQSLY